MENVIIQDCTEGSGIYQKAKLCSHIEFPNHPHIRRRGMCGHKLVKTVELIDKKIFYPYLTYCYFGLKVSLEILFMRPGFSELIEENFKRNLVSQEKLSDVYQGKVWSDFQEYGNRTFLSCPNSLGLMMNFDFFQPYKHVAYSVGAIYMVIMNLPRNVRFKRENVLLIGILPGPKEPSKDINAYLDPLVDELLVFFDGVEVNVYNAINKKIKCALLGVSSDIPAGRKACGFLGHTAHFGCSKCSKQFTGDVGNMDYSGFDRDSWPIRTVAGHRTAVDQILKCCTKTARQKIESETGFRNTALLNLPYFDTCRMLLIDPMHNLYLGSAKHTLKAIWIEKDILRNSDFEVIQSRVDGCVVPTDIGRIPHKILSGFSSFTADQFKNWVIYYSLIALRGLLCDEHLECWRHFVLACRLLSQHILSKDNIVLADALLLKFCRRTELLYGASVVTPNMHFHCHLKSCLFDFGPLHAFWCFPFKRYNGLLGSAPNNNRSIEVQMMDSFVNHNTFLSSPLPDTFANELRPLMPGRRKLVGSLSESIDGHSDFISQVVLPKCFERCLFVSEEVEELRVLYSKLYAGEVIEIPSSFRKYKSLSIYGKQLGSYKSRSSHSSIVMIKWNNLLFNSITSISDELRPARINYFASFFIPQKKDQPVIIASVSWFQQHPNKNICGKPLTIWENEIFETTMSNLIPIQYIHCRTISLVDIVDVSNALIVCPCVDF